MIGKLICLALCALLIFVCYRARFVAERIFKREEPSESFLLRIKLSALIAAAALFAVVMILFG